MALLPDKFTYPSFRKWPYPFRAGLAISNDPDLTNFEFFETFFEFLNTSNKTPLGTGINLEVSSTLFHFSDDPRSFSYFEGISSNRSKYAKRIDEFIQAGFIDGTHSIGDFSKISSLQKRHIELFFDVIQSYPETFSVYTNHGGFSNQQNIGFQEYHGGSESSSDYYLTDKLAQSDIKFVWHDSLYIEILQQPLIRKILNPNPLKHHILSDIKFSDGTSFTGFHRLRNTGSTSPNLLNFGRQIESIDWKSFINNSHGVVVYQHLGVLKKEGNLITPMTIDNFIANRDTILEPFYFLSDLNSSQILWISRLATFLLYLLLIKELQIEFKEDGTLQLVSNKTFSVSELLRSPLCIYVQKDWSGTIKYQDFDLPYQKNGIDEKGLYSVSLVPPSIESIW